MGQEKIVILQIKLTRKGRLLALVAAFICLYPRISGSEKMTLVTYYPAPYGAYVSMLTTQQTLLARDGGAVGIGYRRTGTAKLAINGNVGIGITNPQSPAPNDQGNNLDVNDIYLRSTNQWMSLVESGVGFLHNQIYNAGSSDLPGTFTVPAGVVKIKVEAWGGGGGGILMCALVPGGEEAEPTRWVFLMLRRWLIMLLLWDMEGPAVFLMKKAIAEETPCFPAG